MVGMKKDVTWQLKLRAMKKMGTNLSLHCTDDTVHKQADMYIFSNFFLIHYVRWRVQKVNRKMSQRVRGYV